MADGFNKEVHPRETGSRRGQLEKGKGKDGKGAGLCKVVLFRWIPQRIPGFPGFFSLKARELGFQNSPLLSHCLKAPSQEKIAPITSKVLNKYLALKAINVIITITVSLLLEHWVNTWLCKAASTVPGPPSPCEKACTHSLCKIANMCPAHVPKASPPVNGLLLSKYLKQMLSFQNSQQCFYFHFSSAKHSVMRTRMKTKLGILHRDLPGIDKNDMGWGRKTERPMKI